MESWTGKYPYLAHLTVEEAVPAIRALGLRPAAWLVDRAVGSTDEQLGAHLEEPRREPKWIEVENWRVRLRDQQPLLDQWPRYVADPDGPAGYLEGLNASVFLYPAEDDGMARPVSEGLSKLQNKYHGDRAVLLFDTMALLGSLEAYGSVRMTDGNPGAYGRNPANERPLTRADWLGPSDWDRAHPRGMAPGEVLVGNEGIWPELLEECLVDIV